MRERLNGEKVVGRQRQGKVVQRQRQATVGMRLFQRRKLVAGSVLIAIFRREGKDEGMDAAQDQRSVVFGGIACDGLVEVLPRGVSRGRDVEGTDGFAIEGSSGFEDAFADADIVEEVTRSVALGLGKVRAQKTVKKAGEVLQGTRAVREDVRRADEKAFGLFAAAVAARKEKAKKTGPGERRRGLRRVDTGMLNVMGSVKSPFLEDAEIDLLVEGIRAVGLGRRNDDDGVLSEKSVRVAAFFSFDMTDAGRLERRVSYCTVMGVMLGSRGKNGADNVRSKLRQVGASMSASDSEIGLGTRAGVPAFDVPGLGGLGDGVGFGRHGDKEQAKPESYERRKRDGQCRGGRRESRR